MKNTITFFSLIFISCYCIGQVDTLDVNESELIQAAGDDFEDALFYKKDKNGSQNPDEPLGDRNPFTGIMVEYYYGTKNVSWAMECINGKTTTWYKSYFKNGQINSEIQMGKTGMYAGSAKEWDEKGKLKASGNYKNGEKNGKWKIWTETGELERVEKYKMGKLVAEE